MSNILTYREYFEKKTGLKAPTKMSVSAIFQNADVCKSYSCNEPNCSPCWNSGEKNPILFPDYKERMQNYRFTNYSGSDDEWGWQENCYGEHQISADVILQPTKQSN